MTRPPPAASPGRTATPVRLPPAPAYLLRLAAVAVLYYAAAKLGLSMALVQENASPVWPPAGIAVAAVLLLGPGVWPAIAAGAFLSTWQTGIPVAVAAAIAGGNTLKALLAAYLFLTVAPGRPALRRLRDVLAFLLFASMLAPALSASVGVGSLVLGGIAPPADAPALWLVWWTGDAVGVLVVGSAILVWAGRRLDRPRRRYRLWFAVLLATLVPTSLLVFGGPAGTTDFHYPLSYAVFPFVIWAALRLGQRGAATVAVVVAAAAITSTLRGLGPFSRESVQATLLSVQAFVALVTVSGLVLSALISEREAAHRRERWARARAEEAERRSALLAEVGVALSGSLDYRETLNRVSALCVPRLADACIIDEVHPDGSFGTVVAVHRDPARTRLLAELRRRYPPVRNPNSRVARVLRTGRAELVEQVGDADLDRLAQDPEHRRLLREVGMRSGVAVPLVARERTLGVMTLTRTEPGRPYTRGDLLFVEEVAARAALYLDNARLFEETRQAGEARKRVVSLVSHEIRNPLSTILLNATDLEDRPPLAEADRRVESIVLAAGQISHLVADLVDITRLEFGAGTMERASVSPRSLLREAAMMLEPIARRAGLRLVVEALDDLPPVWGSRDRLVQVVSNLVGNAVRFTPAEGTITLRAEPAGGEIRFSVEDTGTGIPEELQAHLFAPVWRAPRETRTGAGLGLPLARAIVEAQGGRMWVRSAPGEGTVFFFTVPVEGGEGDGSA